MKSVSPRADPAEVSRALSGELAFLFRDSRLSNSLHGALPNSNVFDNVDRLV